MSKAILLSSIQALEADGFPTTTTLTGSGLVRLRCVAGDSCEFLEFKPCHRSDLEGWVRSIQISCRQLGRQSIGKFVPRPTVETQLLQVQSTENKNREALLENTRNPFKVQLQLDGLRSLTGLPQRRRIAQKRHAFRQLCCFYFVREQRISEICEAETRLSCVMYGTLVRQLLSVLQRLRRNRWNPAALPDHMISIRNISGLPKWVMAHVLARLSRSVMVKSLHQWRRRALACQLPPPQAPAILVRVLCTLTLRRKSAAWCKWICKSTCDQEASALRLVIGLTTQKRNLLQKVVAITQKTGSQVIGCMLARIIGRNMLHNFRILKCGIERLSLPNDPRQAQPKAAQHEHTNEKPVLQHIRNLVEEPDFAMQSATPSMQGSTQEVNEKQPVQPKLEKDPQPNEARVPWPIMAPRRGA